MQLGEFDIVSPPEHLRCFVRRYLYANRRLASAVTFRPKPTGYAYLTNIFCRYDRHRAVVNGRDVGKLSRWFFFGQITDHDIAFHHSHLRFVSCELAATSPYRLLGLAGPRILGLADTLGNVASEPARIARECFIRGVSASVEDHIAEANVFFSRLAETALPEDAVVEYAVRAIEQSNGGGRVGAMCKDMGISTRELNRRFSRVVGLSPKTFAQIMQIKRVLELLFRHDAEQLARIAQDAGFYDQSHFNRAIRRFFQEGPRALACSDIPGYRAFLADTGTNDIDS